MTKLSPRPPDKSAQLKIIVLISHPKHMLWVLKTPKTYMFILMGKKIITILSKLFLLNWPYALTFNDCVRRNLLSILVPWGNLNTILMTKLSPLMTVF